MPTVEQLSAEYERVTQTYMTALRTEEVARLNTLQSSDSDTINAWLDACKATEQLNEKRLAARYALLRSINPNLF